MPLVRDHSLRGGDPPDPVPQARPAARGKVRAGPLTGLAAAALLAGSGLPALADPPCVREAEKAAFDIRALQTRLMVVALTCQRHDDYDAFVHRHQRGLLGAYNEVGSHFRRLHGPAMGEEQRDQFITELANAHSEASIRQGGSFCRVTEAFVRQALELRDAGEVARYSASLDLPTPYPLAVCAPLPAGTVTAEAAAAAGGERKRDTARAAAPRERDTQVARAGGAARERGGTRSPDARDAEILQLRARLDQLERSMARSPDLTPVRGPSALVKDR